MLLTFCKEMGLSSVVLVGHDDGGLLALKAAQRVKASGSLIDVSNKLSIYFFNFSTNILFNFRWR